MRGDLIALAPKPDNSYGQRVTGNLEAAQGWLQCSDAQAAAGAISQADQALVWLSPDSTLDARAQQVLDALQARRLTVAARRLAQARSFRSEADQAGGAWSDAHWRQVAAAVSEAIGVLALSQQEEWINNDLQVARLRLLSIYVGAALILTLAATMIVANPTPVHGWPVHFLASFPTPLSSLVASAGVAVLGAGGGLFSGLLATQGAAASLLGYRTSVSRLTLKPLVGALMACIVYIALSWQVVPGITVTNGGTFLVLGFVTGFSERYVLRILNVPGASDSSASGEREASHPDQKVQSQPMAEKDQSEGAGS